MRTEIIAIIERWKSKPGITISERIAGMAKEVNEYNVKHAMIKQVAVARTRFVLIK